MSDSKDRSNVLRTAISVCAIILMVAHLVLPSISIDQITVTLFIVAIVPWLSSVFKSLDLPGVGKLEFQQLKDQVDPVIAAASEPALQPTPSGITAIGFSINKQRDGPVLEALADSKYTWRYLGGIKQASKLSEEEVLASINWLKDNRLVAETVGRDGRLWALTPEGRNLYNAVSQTRRAS